VASPVIVVSVSLIIYSRRQKGDDDAVKTIEAQHIVLKVNHIYNTSDIHLIDGSTRALTPTL
jgi:hypothetical protein